MYINRLFRKSLYLAVEPRSTESGRETICFIDWTDVGR